MTHPTVTKEHIAAIMAGLQYTFVIIPDTTTTICSAVHPNGFTLALGESACVCPENFNVETGQHWAKEDAMKKAEKELWKLEGYLLKHQLTEPTFNHYIEAVNEEANDFLSFGDAVAAMKSGYKVARVGWNGAGMFAYYVPAATYPAQCDAIKGEFPDNQVPYRHYMALKTAQGDVSTWAPSGSDALAEDWVIVTNE